MPRTFRLDPGKIAAAQRVLGAKSQTDTIEQALDLVLLRDRLVQGTRRMYGRRFTYPDAGEEE